MKKRLAERVGIDRVPLTIYPPEETADTLLLSKRSRLFVNTVGAQIGSDVLANEPAEQQVVTQLLHQHPLAANRVENLPQLCPQQSVE
jgi:hypothetical protein